MKKSDRCAQRIKKPGKIYKWRGVTKDTSWQTLPERYVLYICFVSVYNTYINIHKHPFCGYKVTSLTADVVESEALVFLWWEMFVQIPRMLLGHESCFQTCKKNPTWTQLFLIKTLLKNASPSRSKMSKKFLGSHPWQIFHVRVPESHGTPCLSPLDQDPDQPTGSQSDSPQEKTFGVSMNLMVESKESNLYVFDRETMYNI